MREKKSHDPKKVIRSRREVGGDLLIQGARDACTNATATAKEHRCLPYIYIISTKSLQNAVACHVRCIPPSLECATTSHLPLALASRKQKFHRMLTLTFVLPSRAFCLSRSLALDRTTRASTPAPPHMILVIKRQLREKVKGR